MFNFLLSNNLNSLNLRTELSYQTGPNSKKKENIILSKIFLFVSILQLEPILTLFSNFLPQNSRTKIRRPKKGRDLRINIMRLGVNFGKRNFGKQNPRVLCPPRVLYKPLLWCWRRSRRSSCFTLLFIVAKHGTLSLYLYLPFKFLPICHLNLVSLCHISV